MKVRKSIFDPDHSRKNRKPFKLQTSRGHLEIVTNRKRSLYVELISPEIAILTIETAIIYTTIRHYSDGKLLKSRDKTKVSSRNIGLVSRYSGIDLVKLIYIRDIPEILKEFYSGKSLNQIKYSTWPMINDRSTTVPMGVRKPDSCDRLIQSLFQIRSSFYMSAYKTSTLTYRIIKRISNMIGF